MVIETGKGLWSGLDWPGLHSSCRLRWHFSFNMSFYGERKKRAFPLVSLSSCLPLPSSSALLTITPFPSFFLTACSLESSFCPPSPPSPPLFQYFWLLKLYGSRMWSHTPSNIFNHIKICHDFCFFTLSSLRLPSPPPSEALREIWHTDVIFKFITVFLQTHFCSRHLPSDIICSSIHAFACCLQMLS